MKYNSDDQNLSKADFNQNLPPASFISIPIKTKLENRTAKDSNFNPIGFPHPIHHQVSFVLLDLWLLLLGYQS